MNMVRLFVAGLGLLLAGMMPLHATLIFQFDEFGNGSYSIDGGVVYEMPGALVIDPTSSGYGEVLYYNLAPGLIQYNILHLGSVPPLYSGDVPIGKVGGGLSDDLRFTDATGNLASTNPATWLIFYSFDSLGALAHVGPILPSDLTTPSPAAFQTSGGFTYSVNYLRGGFTYNGISGDITSPEPASVSMFLLGLGALGYGALRRKSIR